MTFKIRASIDELMQACDILHEEDCLLCPIESDCLRESTVEDLWNNVSEERLSEFIELADRVLYPEEEITDEDIIAFNADMTRQDDYVYGE